MSECEHKNTVVHKNIGFDIYMSDNNDLIEENQHIEECLDCHLERFIFECISCSGLYPDETHKSKWNKAFNE